MGNNKPINLNNNGFNDIMLKLRNRYLFVIDFLVFMTTPFIAYALRFDGFNYETVMVNLLLYGVIFAVIKILILYFFGVYSRWWLNASIEDMMILLKSSSVILIFQILILYLIRIFEIRVLSQIPVSVTILDALLGISAVALGRLSFRLYKHSKLRRKYLNKSDKESILIYGAGAAGVMALDELRINENSKLEVKGFIDDDPQKQGMFIRGIKVLGSKDDLREIVSNHKISKILIAIPTASGKQIREIVELCKKIDNLEIMTVPALYDIIDGKIEISKLRKVEIDDLLRRDPIRTDIEKIAHEIKGRIVLVTGGGGSIGKEICRQVLRFNPSKLIILGHGENSVFESEMEMKRLYPLSNIKPFVTNVSDELGVKKLFREHSIDYVFHAAAHKHVPLMENHPYEAIRNNILGTKVLLDACVENNVLKFILISTDKAVNPTNIMGVTKRIAEMLVIHYSYKYNQKFSLVRFGNVLGSRGSVVKIFKSQIEQGGPVTVTHKEMTRYFMTIPEAVQLVMQAFVMGNGGEIFIFDMGEPVKIVDLAKNMIELSGLKEGEDIDIKITGLRPGEKLYEELFNGKEKFTKTLNEKIYKSDHSFEIIPNNFEMKLTELFELISNQSASDEDLKLILRDIVPEYEIKNEEGTIKVEKLM